MRHVNSIAMMNHAVLQSQTSNDTMPGGSVDSSMASMGCTATDQIPSYIWQDEVQNLNKQRLGRLLIEAAHTFWGEDTLFDYRIMVEGEEYRVHKFVIAAVSDFFKTMLTCSLKESSEDFVELKGVTKAGFLPILHHIYSNTQMNLTKDNVMDILYAASLLQIKFIMEECLRYLKNVVDETNCVDVLNLTYTFQQCKEPNLEKLAVEFIVVHLDQLVQDKEICRLSVDALKYVISQEWLERSEMFLLDMIKDWVYDDEDETEMRLRQVGVVVAEIRFGLIRPEHLKRIKNQYEFLNLPDCQKHVDDALNYHNLKMNKQVLSQSKSTSVRDDPTVVAFGGMFYSEKKDEESRQSSSMFALGQAWDAVEVFHLPNSKFRQCAVAVVNNFMLVCGGLKNPPDESSTGRCFIFDPRISRWGRIASMNVPRANFALVVHEENLFAFGGEQRNIYTQIVERYSFQSDRWEVVARSARGLCAPGACSFDGQIYLIGGKYRDPNGRLKMSKDVQIFDPVTFEWANRPSLRAAQSGHTVFPMISRNTITPRIWTPECCLYVISKNGQTIDSYFPNCCIWQRVRLRDRPPNSASVVCVENVVYYVNGWTAGQEGERHYGACCEYDPTGSTDSFGYPANKAGFMPLSKYPEEVDGILCCVLAPNYYLKKDQLKVS